MSVLPACVTFLPIVMFNLAAPPGFRGLHPDLPVRFYQRHLPHWRQEGATYFVTFRLADALPQTQLQFLKRLRAEWERLHPPPRTERDWQDYSREIARHAEAWLDEGYGKCLLRERQQVETVRNTLLRFQGERCFVSCFVMMPNHCHVILAPLPGYDLAELLKGAKGAAAREINLAIGGQGQLWQEESYDRILRDEEHLWRAVQYIGSNPRRAGLADENWRRWIVPEWEAAGWKFVDEA